MDSDLLAGLPPTPEAPAARRPGRRGWVAGLLSLPLCGLGQLYAGRWLRALIFFLADAFVSLACLLAFVHVRTEPLNLWFPVGAYVAYRLWVILDAVHIARRVASGFRRRWFTRWYVYVAFLAWYAFLGRYHRAMPVRDYVIHAFRIQTKSMSDTLLPGDHFFVDKLLYGEPARLDVVAFAWTDTDGTEQVFVDRIVGLPGERVQVVNGKALIDGRALEEPYVRTDDSYGGDFGPVVVPPDSYFVLGDWRSRSKDSRHPDVGFVGRAQIVGAAMTIAVSLDPESGDTRWERIGTVIR